MKQLQFPDFPPAEYVTRYKLTQQALRAHGLDALLLTQRQNLRYFAGLRDGAWDAYHFYFIVLLPAEGEPVLFAANGFNHLLSQSWIADIRQWPWQKEFYLAKESNAIPLLVDTLHALRLDAGVIGMELSPDIHIHMGQLHFEALRRALPVARIVDGSDVIWELRSVKSPAEIERLRKAAQLTARGVKAGFEALRPGISEKELMAVMTSAMCAGGATELRFNALYAGPRAMWADGMPTAYVLQPGDLVQYDGGCVYEGYWCDFKRMAALGEPRADQRRFYDLARQGLEAALAVIRPGVPFSAPLHAAFAVNDRAGYGDFSRWCLANGWSAIGHSLGLDIHESPGLSATNTTLIREHMVLSVEPFITLDGVFPFWEASEKFGLEDVVVVTSDGVELLTSEAELTHALWVAS